MTRVILIRHGETDWNRQRIFRGRADVLLSPEGIRQAELVTITLKEIGIDAIYSSPLKRALQTAQKIADFHNLEVVVEPGFMDFDYGEWQGLSHQEVRKRYPELYSRWEKEPHTVRTPGGESLQDVRKRSVNALEKVLAEHPSRTVVIVSHRVVNKVLLCFVLGLDNSHFWRIRQDTCAINIFEWSEDRGYVLYLLNDTCHLYRLTESGRRVDF